MRCFDYDEYTKIVFDKPTFKSLPNCSKLGQPCYVIEADGSITILGRREVAKHTIDYLFGDKSNLWVFAISPFTFSSNILPYPDEDMAIVEIFNYIEMSVLEKHRVTVLPSFLKAFPCLVFHNITENDMFYISTFLGNHENWGQKIKYCFTKNAANEVSVQPFFKAVNDEFRYFK